MVSYSGRNDNDVESSRLTVRAQGTGVALHLSYDTIKVTVLDIVNRHALNVSKRHIIIQTTGRKYNLGLCV